ncbi:MAG: SH3 domain-containing protein [Pseudomonadota bacterium]
MTTRRILLGTLAIAATAVTLQLSPLSTGSAEACAFCGKYQVIGVESWDVLNVRSGPSASHQKVGALPFNGRNIRLAGDCSGKWCTIKFFGTSAWVNTDFLTPQ